jgi:hypothetical protein
MKAIWFVVYGIGMFIMLAISELFTACASLLIAAFTIAKVHFGQP